MNRTRQVNATRATEPAGGPDRVAVHRSGSGAPVVLLHALGSASPAWEPVVPALSQRFDVLAVDLPGFGESDRLPVSITPTPAALAAAVARTLDAKGIDEPHVVGNSLGGWVALELAAIKPLASVTLLSPAGLWQRTTPLYCRVSLRITRWLALHVPGLLNRLVDHRLGRILLLGQSHGRPGRIPPAAARAAVLAMGTCAGFDATLAATIHRSYAPPAPVEVPVTVAFGSRDRILLRRQWRSTERLPAHTEIADLPGCGHIPMADDPEAVTRLITVAAGRTGRARARP
jgi:pimeloyl-ACP methyl ester carboxylesterase